MRMTIVIAALISAALVITACQKGKEPTVAGTTRNVASQPLTSITPTLATEQTPSDNAVPAAPQPEENVPFITEVMTKEELDAYLKEKGILILTKETFKKPELVWEKTFSESIKMNDGLSDLTERGNCIAISIPPDVIAEAQKNVLFLDDKGNTKKKIEFNDIKDKTTWKNKVRYQLIPAKSGKYIGVFKTNFDKSQATFTYYDEEGNRLWEKATTNEVWSNDKPISVSYDGSVIAATTGNPRWNTEDESLGDQNINKLMFFDSRGKLLSEYGGFRNVSIGKFSDNGEYYAAIIWFSGGVNTGWTKLLYIRTKDGKVMWERPNLGDPGIGPGDETDLTISQKGTYVAARKWLKDMGKNEKTEMQVFDNSGKMIARAATGGPIHENGLFFSRYVIDITKRKILSLTSNPGTFNPRYFFNWKGSDSPSYSFISFDGTVLWKTPNDGFINYSNDWAYLKMNGYFKNGKNIIKIYRFLNSGGMPK